MQIVRTEFPRPTPWRQFRRRAHTIFLPLLYIDWLIQWSAFFLSRWSLIEVLEYAGRFSILIAVIFYFAESRQRAQMRHYQAWQVINTAQGKGGSGGRIEALSELNDDHVSLIAVDVSGAVLQGVRLGHADLHRAKFEQADLRDAQLDHANLQFADFNNANLRNADLRNANLEDADLSLTDLTGAKLNGANLRGVKLDDADLTDTDCTDVQNWREIRSIEAVQADRLRAAPAGFADWVRSQQSKRAATTDLTQPRTDGN